MAWHDVVSKYRRTSLGPFWSIIITAISIFCMGTLGAILFKINIKEFLSYVACGMIVWTYISSIILESCGVFLQNANIIQNVRLPLLTFTLRMFLRNSILFLHSLVILFIILIATSTFNFQSLYILPSFLIFGLNAVSLCIILGFFSTRYRDVIHMVQAILSIIILLTPIMWKVEMLGEYSYLAHINPFTHFIAIFRNPLLGIEISPLNYYYVGIATLINMIFASYLYRRFKNRLVFWL